MIEEWKDIKDYENLYQISNLGRVKSLKREIIDSKFRKRIIKEKILKLCKDKNGYLEITLHKDKKAKTFLVHRLVALYFVEGYFEGAHVDHIDTNKENNIYTNLRFVTQKENNNNPLSKKKLSESKKGHEAWNKGKPMSEEQKKLMSETRKEKGVAKGRNNPKALKLICIYPDGTQTEPMCKKELSEYLGISKGTLDTIFKNGQPYKPRYKKDKHLKGIIIIKLAHITGSRTSFKIQTINLSRN